MVIAGGQINPHFVVPRPPVGAYLAHGIDGAPGRNPALRIEAIDHVVGHVVGLHLFAKIVGDSAKAAQRQGQNHSLYDLLNQMGHFDLLVGLIQWPLDFPNANPGS